MDKINDEKIKKAKSKEKLAEEKKNPEGPGQVVGQIKKEVHKL